MNKMNISVFNLDEGSSVGFTKNYLLGKRNKFTLQSSQAYEYLFQNYVNEVIYKLLFFRK